MAQRDRPTADTPRVQRVLATMAFTLIGVSAVAVVVLLVLQGVGVPAERFAQTDLVVLALLPLPGLTLGLLLMIVVIAMTAIRRARS